MRPFLCVLKLLFYFINPPSGQPHAVLGGYPFSKTETDLSCSLTVHTGNLAEADWLARCSCT